MSIVKYINYIILVIPDDNRILKFLMTLYSSHNSIFSYRDGAAVAVPVGTDVVEVGVVVVGVVVLWEVQESTY